MEHHSNIVPWQMLCEERGAQLRVAPIDDCGALLLDELEALLTPQTRLLSRDAHVERARAPSTRSRPSCSMAHAHGQSRAGRRLAGGVSHAGRRARAGLRLLRRDRPQAVRADRHRRALRPRGAARGDAAVPGRRRHDPLGHVREDRPGTTCRTSSKPARRTSPARSASARRSTTSRGVGLDADRRARARSARLRDRGAAADSRRCG